MDKPMGETVSAADANRKFSSLLRAVREGHTYVVTSHGKPVAKIVPIGMDDKVTTAARTALFTRLRDRPVLNVGRWTREELYEDER
jgi:prevent-host-death family protein